jgi:cyclohexyl-isocyanide hydratase
MLSQEQHLNKDLDQIDLTVPFEVLSRTPNATHRIYARSIDPVRDHQGLRIAPDATLAEAPQLDILHVPGGRGQEALMEDEEVLGWLRAQTAGASKILSVCTGALLCGAAGLIRRKRATTHWAFVPPPALVWRHPVDKRVVGDGNWIFAAGVTAGIDGALRLAAEVRGAPAAQRIQLDIAYAPEPPFQSGTPRTAPPAILEAARRDMAGLIARRRRARIGLPQSSASRQITCRGQAGLATIAVRIMMMSLSLKLGIRRRRVGDRRGYERCCSRRK